MNPRFCSRGKKIEPARSGLKRTTELLANIQVVGLSAATDKKRSGQSDPH